MNGPLSGGSGSPRPPRSSASSLAIGWGWDARRRARSEVARLVLDLAESPPPGGLRDVLAEIVGDPSLVVAYPLDDSDRLVDAQGRPVELPAAPHARRSSRTSGRSPCSRTRRASSTTRTRRRGRRGRAARARERAPAGGDPRAARGAPRSRARIVDTADAERRRLERDLHDGAQQRLVGLSLSLRLVRSRLPAGDRRPRARSRRQTPSCGRAIEELRELAHGIFPAVLADEGLAAGARRARRGVARPDPRPRAAGRAIRARGRDRGLHGRRRAARGRDGRARRHGGRRPTASLVVEVEPAATRTRPRRARRPARRARRPPRRRPCGRRRVRIRAELPCAS